MELDDPMEVIESFQVEQGEDGRVVVLCLKGPDSAYKKRKLNEDAVTSLSGCGDGTKK